MVLAAGLLLSFCISTIPSGAGASLGFQKGMSYTAWSHDTYLFPRSDESLLRMAAANVEWVAICFWWFQDDILSTRIYPRPDLYTASNESIVHAIETAHSLGLKVMLKPMVDAVGPSWRGLIPPSAAWFESYGRFISSFAELAEETGVELYCVGCELDAVGPSWRGLIPPSAAETGVELYCVGCEFDFNDIAESDWRGIVSGVRSRYSGPLTYAAGPARVAAIRWWDALDYVGIDAYYPLSNGTDPTMDELVKSWNAVADVIEEWQAGVGKPVIFTEVGYRSGDGANRAPWNWHVELQVDLQEQADCYGAAFSVLWNRSWFHGSYWWNWETEPQAGGDRDDGYTPQNKPAQQVLADWYALDWDGRVFPVAFPCSGAALLVVLAVLVRGRTSRKGDSARCQDQTGPEEVVSYGYFQIVYLQKGDNIPVIAVLLR